jgi:AbrB family looped-hinge helix DNA binding protein
MKLLGNSRLTSKFQVTVPRHVRETLRLDAGDLLLYVKDHNQVILKRGKIKIEA